MHGHLIAVEVGIESGADERMDADRVPFDEDRLERLNADAVQRGCSIQKDGVVVDDLFEDVPDFLILAVQHALRALDGVRKAHFLESADDERLIELEGDLLRETALMELELRPDDDDRAR